MSRHLKKVKDIIIYNSNKIKLLEDNINKLKDSEFVAIYNSENIGVTSSTLDLFKENTISIKEVLNIKEIELISKLLVEAKIKQIIFSSITFGYISLIKKIKYLNPNIKIKIFWHGSFSMFVQRDEAYFLDSIMELMNLDLIDSIAFAKESMFEYYKLKGYNTCFLPNTVKLNKLEEIKENDLEKKSNIEKENKLNEKIKIGIYSAGDRWEKNTFNQLSSIKLIDKAQVEVIPCNKLVIKFCNDFNIDLISSDIKHLNRADFINKLGDNDINLYVTFTECSPMLPLESFESGVICITGNNHHYFKGNDILEKTIVSSEDNIDEIKDKVMYALENKEDILKEYKKWKISYDKYCSKKLEAFINY